MTKITKSGLGKKSARLLSILAENNKTIFTVDEATKILKEKKSSATKLLHDLVKSNWLHRLTKGKYLILPLEASSTFSEHELVVASCLIKPSYISYWSAINYYGFTEQVSKTIFIAATKRKRALNIIGLNFKFVTLNKNKFFGFKKILINGNPAYIAEKEKAIIDCLDMPRYCGGITEAIKSIDSAKEELNFKKLADYAKKMKNNAVINRLGFILDLLNIKISLKPGKYYVYLDPLIKKKIKYNKKWKIIENIPKNSLLSWRAH